MSDELTLLAAEETAAVGVPPAALVVVLETPLKRGEEDVHAVTLRAIVGRDCAGLSLAKLAISSYDELRTLLPRVSNLIEEEVDLLASDDLVDVIVDMGELVEPDEAAVGGLSLRKPLGGDLRNVSIARLQHLYYEELRTIVPRITTPRLTSDDIDAMPLAKLMGLASRVSNFLLTTRRRAEFRIE